jgi:hypothetical protein
MGLNVKSHSGTAGRGRFFVGSLCDARDMLCGITDDGV